ncbi:PA2169 family four-helix-bundle protein [Paraburkholderia sp. LEh10]|uniref:PA2169 family four-helix-bundle protein n=1 Tax=Paraburkholderia sp. LEh10 TaxID=2821353 RepID=UPI001AE6D79F|nr:PA2169 family four-helix-bundle protein [Paraburkholderia sp. LEh10]MBP0596047.1 PA2169 family four-helix-bundle protein [Paraburkholderia sp. LEh10]
MGTNVIAVLNELIGTSEDGERGFMKAAEEAQHASVNDALLELASHCSRGARELQDLVSRLGGKPASGGSVAGALHRGWLDVKSAVGGRTDQRILTDCEKDEDAAEKRFHDALEKDLPADVSAVVQRLYVGVAQNRDRIRVLRDQIASMNS